MTQFSSQDFLDNSLQGFIAYMTRLQLAIHRDPAVDQSDNPRYLAHLFNSFRDIRIATARTKGEAQKIVNLEPEERKPENYQALCNEVRTLIGAIDKAQYTPLERHKEFLLGALKKMEQDFGLAAEDPVAGIADLARSFSEDVSHSDAIGEYTKFPGLQKIFRDGLQASFFHVASEAEKVEAIPLGSRTTRDYEPLCGAIHKTVKCIKNSQYEPLLKLSGDLHNMVTELERVAGIHSSKGPYRG